MELGGSQRDHPCSYQRLPSHGKGTCPPNSDPFAGYQRSAVSSRIHPTLVLFCYWISTFSAKVIVKWSFPALREVLTVLSNLLTLCRSQVTWGNFVTLVLWFWFCLLTAIQKIHSTASSGNSSSYGLRQQPDEIWLTTQKWSSNNPPWQWKLTNSISLKRSLCSTGGRCWKTLLTLAQQCLIPVSVVNAYFCTI